jgi:hypothetical protein
VPAASDPERRPPLAAITAAVLALPAAYLLLGIGNGALALAADRSDGGGATWVVLLLTVGWVAGLLVGAVRLLLGRAWLGLTVSAGLMTALLTVGLVLGGLGGAGSAATIVAWLISAATAVLPALPWVRRWVSLRRWHRLYPGAPQPTSSRP